MLRLLTLAAFLLGAAPALAAESAPVTTARTTASLVSETDAVGVAPFRVGLRLRLAPGWHTYWRNPGDAGVAPELAFDLPQGVAAGAVAFPVPQRQPEGPLMTYGYSGEVLLPVTITPAAPGPVPVKLHATWLVCEKICVPEEGDFSLALPAGPPVRAAQAPLFATADARAPRAMPWTASVAPDGTLSVRDPGLTRDAVRDAWFIPGADGQIEPSAPQRLAVAVGGFSLALQRTSDAKPDASLKGLLVVTDRSGAESFLDVDAPPGPAVAVEPSLPLWQMLALAGLGGLILNLMPCVFPILALKAVGLARLSGAERGHAARHAVAYAAGVMLTFAGLGAALLALRAAGLVAGWGFQFQSPVFVAAIAWLLFAVGLNLSGVFVFGGGIAGTGQTLASKSGLAGSFFTGLLAVLVATPCTAPFMGAAIAAGLAATPGVTVAVFLAMGAGLAAPYVLLAAVPAFARRLPRPGRWMDVLKQALAFPMYAAAAWLVWIMSLEAGPEGVLAAGAGLVLVGFAAWAMRLRQGNTTLNGNRAAFAGACIAILAAFALLGGVAASPVTTTAPADAWAERYSASRLAALQQEGRPVFVNMTAAWCVTCLVNERIALAPDAVRRAFADRHVAYLKGDWTRQDPEISSFLREHGRDGVPLYVLFPGAHRPPEILPQILTQGGMLDRLATVGGG